MPDRAQEFAEIRRLITRVYTPTVFNDLTPPQTMIDRVGGGNYHVVGDLMLGFFRLFCGLTPDMRVLDVGCGCGRVATSLAAYLSPAGSYEGFDVIPDLVEWCQEHITPRHPQFRFRIADIHNGEYRPDQATPAARFTFPYPDNSFDFVFLVSVFTHMLPTDVTHYLAEIHRVLKPGGSVYESYFLLTPQSRGAIDAGQSLFAFTEQHDQYACIAGASQEYAIAYDEAWVRAAHAPGGLAIREIVHGTWCGNADSPTVQDVVIAAKATQGGRAQRWLQRVRRGGFGAIASIRSRRR